MNNSADLGFAGLRQKQADLETQENLLKKLNNFKDELKRLFNSSLDDSISDWQESIDAYLKAKGMKKTNDKYELANISVFPTFPENGNRSKGSYNFNVRVRYTTNMSATTQTVNTIDYLVDIPAVLGSFVDSHYVPSKLEEDIQKYSEMVKDYKEPIFKFNIACDASSVRSTSPLKVASSLGTINEVLDAIFGHFFEKHKP